jgi:hypothetical protein
MTLCAPSKRRQIAMCMRAKKKRLAEAADRVLDDGIQLDVAHRELPCVATATSQEVSEIGSGS